MGIALRDVNRLCKNITRLLEFFLRTSGKVSVNVQNGNQDANLRVREDRFDLPHPWVCILLRLWMIEYCDLSSSPATTVRYTGQDSRNGMYRYQNLTVRETSYDCLITIACDDSRGMSKPTKVV